MAAATKRRKPTQAKAKSDSKPVKEIGNPIRIDQTYTNNQLFKQLGISRTTLHRWRAHHGLESFGVATGVLWQITGQRYMDWLEWRHQTASKTSE